MPRTSRQEAAGSASDHRQGRDGTGRSRRRDDGDAGGDGASGGHREPQRAGGAPGRDRQGHTAAEDVGRRRGGRGLDVSPFRLDELPDDIKVRVLSNLDARTTMQLMSTSSRWYRASLRVHCITLEGHAIGNNTSGWLGWLALRSRHVRRLVFHDCDIDPPTLSETIALVHRSLERLEVVASAKILPLHTALLAGLRDQLLAAGPDETAAHRRRPRQPLTFIYTPSNRDMGRFLTRNIHEAARSNMVGEVLAHLTLGTAVDLRGRQEMTPLHVAAASGAAAAIRLLVQRGARVDARDVSGQTPLLKALWAGDALGTPDELFAADVVNVADMNGTTPLHCCVHPRMMQTVASDERLALTRRLLDLGADPNETRTVRAGKYVLHTAMHRAPFAHAAVRLLLRSGNVLVDPRDDNGATPLHDAAVAANVDLLELLTDFGADVNAVCRWHPDVRSHVALLVTRTGLDPHSPPTTSAPGTPPSSAATTAQEMTSPTMSAVSAVSPVSSTASDSPPPDSPPDLASVVHAASWPDLRALFPSGLALTALHISCLLNAPAAVASLLQHGADVHMRMASGHTPLLLACAVGAFDCAKVLLADGRSDVDAVDRQHLEYRAIHYATLARQVDLVRKLIDHGAETSPMTTDRRTPIQMATSSPHAAVPAMKTIVELLLEQSARTMDPSAKFWD